MPLVLVPADDERLGVVVTEPGPSRAWSAATRFAIAGHLVVVGAPQIAAAEEAAGALRNQGATAFGAQLDLTKVASIRAFAATAGYLAGPIDVLIGTVGASPIPSPRDTIDISSRSLGAQHLAAQLLDTKPQRPRPDLLIVSFRSGWDRRPPKVFSSAVFLNHVEQLDSVEPYE